jgi:hypothetical protein
MAQGHPTHAALDGVVAGERSVEVVGSVGGLALAGVMQFVADPAEEGVEQPWGEFLPP